jgi:hypothetical protein
VKEFKLPKQLGRKLDDHFNKEFHQRILMEVTKRVTEIMGDTELQKKLASINVDDEFNK